MRECLPAQHQQAFVGNKHAPAIVVFPALVVKEKHFFCDIWIFQFFDGKNAVEKKRLNLACLTGISILLSSTILQITGKNVQPSWPESP